MNRTKFLLAGAVLLFAMLSIGGRFESAAADPSSLFLEGQLWQDVSARSVEAVRGPTHPLPQSYRLVQADFAQLQSRLAAVVNSRSADRSLELELPLPQGGFGRFVVTSAPIMEPELAAKYPQLQTFIAQGIDDPTASGRLDITPQGFHGYVQAADGEIYIDPLQGGDVDHYISYFKTAATKIDQKLVEKALDDGAIQFDPFMSRSVQANLSVGDIKRTYQLLISATGEFAEAQCAQPGAECLTAQQAIDTAMAGIVTGINRVTQVYEQELAVSFMLVNGTDQLIFADADSDPYTSDTDDIAVVLDELPGVIDGTVPLENYDIGHVLSSGEQIGGGIAGRFDCDATDHVDKATGATALLTVVGDPFWVDYVAHEVGHQFFADHSYNASISTNDQNACSTRSAAEAYEPGSGSTIMSYVGICFAQDLQSTGADAMFNAGAFNEIVQHISTGSGSTCADETETGNTPPTVDAGANYTIPRDTPFSLAAGIGDAEQLASALTVSWEQYSTGRAWTIEGILPNTDQQDGQARPIFRVFPPSINNVRIFPSLGNILDSTYKNKGEDLPSIDQTMTFRATVRDNAAGGGGVASDDMQLTVEDNAGPFRVTSHDAPMTLNPNAMTEVTWDVAGTNQFPVSCTAVDIALSFDGGQTFPLIMVGNSPNDGTHMVTVPSFVTASSQGRFRVKCTNNIFFDINRVDLTVTAGEPFVGTDFVYLPMVRR